MKNLIGRKIHISHFWRHFIEMFVAMAIGMAAATTIFTATMNISWLDALTQYPAEALVVMAAGMTIPMAAWMLYRGMGRKNVYEMSAAMLLPVVPFLCLVWLNVGNGAQCGAYCAITVLAMLALMYWRRDVYSMNMSKQEESISRTRET